MDDIFRSILGLPKREHKTDDNDGDIFRRDFWSSPIPPEGDDSQKEPGVERQHPHSDDVHRQFEEMIKHFDEVFKGSAPGDHQQDSSKPLPRLPWRDDSENKTPKDDRPWRPFPFFDRLWKMPAHPSHIPIEDKVDKDLDGECNLDGVLESLNKPQEDLPAERALPTPPAPPGQPPRQYHYEYRSYASTDGDRVEERRVGEDGETRITRKRLEDGRYQTTTTHTRPDGSISTTETITDVPAGSVTPWTEHPQDDTPQIFSRIFSSWQDK